MFFFAHDNHCEKCENLTRSSASVARKIDSIYNEYVVTKMYKKKKKNEKKFSKL